MDHTEIVDDLYDLADSRVGRHFNFKALRTALIKLIELRFSERVGGLMDEEPPAWSLPLDEGYDPVAMEILNVLKRRTDDDEERDRIAGALLKRCFDAMLPQPASA